MQSGCQSLGVWGRMHRAAPAPPALAGPPNDHKLFLQLISPVSALLWGLTHQGLVLEAPSPQAMSCPRDRQHPPHCWHTAVPGGSTRQAPSHGNSILQRQAGHGLRAPQPQHSLQQHGQPSSPPKNTKPAQEPGTASLLCRATEAEATQLSCS